MGRILLALLLLAPLAAAQAPTEPGFYNPDTSTPTTMYFHINGFQQFPINTQLPSDKYAQAMRLSEFGHSACVVDPTGSTHLTDRSRHTWYGYSSPSIVEYDVDQDGKPRIHPERGLSYDVELDGAVQPVFRWFLESAYPLHAAMPAVPPQPIPVPEVVLKATVREGDDVSVGAEAFNTGEIVAQGWSDKALLAGSLTPDNDHVTVHDLGDGRFVYEFAFPLEVHKQTIRAEESFNIRVDAYVDNPHCTDPSGAGQGDYTMLDYVLVHTSSDFRPRLDWNVLNPLYIEALHPQLVGEDMVIHTASNSPWGSYDVHGDLSYEKPGMRLEVEGPTPVRSVEQVSVKDHTRGHNQHNEAVLAVWVWDYRADEAADGLYTVRLHVTNDQQTADAYAVATFQIGNGDAEVCSKNIGEDQLVCTKTTTRAEGKQSPGVAPLLVVALLALLARRRP